MKRYSRHLREKHAGISHKCKLCHIRLFRKDYIKKHIESCHKNDRHLLDDQLNPTFAKYGQYYVTKYFTEMSRSDCKFECSECSLMLITEEVLEYHVSRSHGTGSQVSTVQYSTVQYHVQDYTNIFTKKIFQKCDNCNRRFKTSSSLKKHQECCNVLSVSMP